MLLVDIVVDFLFVFSVCFDCVRNGCCCVLFPLNECTSLLLVYLPVDNEDLLRKCPKQNRCVLDLTVHFRVLVTQLALSRVLCVCSLFDIRNRCC